MISQDVPVVAIIGLNEQTDHHLETGWLSEPATVLLCVSVKSRKTSRSGKILVSSRTES